jgi:hypothetical protein
MAGHLGVSGNLNGLGKRRAKVVVQVGWREWFSLPDLRVAKLKAKVDTGARTSALHVRDIQFFKKRNQVWTRFSVFPLQRNSKKLVRASARFLEYRWIKSSNGARSLRPIVETTLQLGSHRWLIELSLVDRDEMGFRMLIGRQGIPKRFVVNPHKSFLFRRPVP